MTTPSKIGLSYCLLFVTLEAFQAVYLGAVFQNVSSFLVGAWVFGISVVVCAAATAVFQPAELLASAREWKIVFALNCFAALNWCMYFFAVQLIEPAVVFTIFSGMVPIATALANACGLPEASAPRRRLIGAGNAVILLSVIVLAGFTLFGLSGFVRGGWLVALAGVALSALAGASTAFVILFSVRLNNRGVGPLAQFGLRYILYAAIALIAFSLGFDDKGHTPDAGELVWIVVIGLLVIAYPLYLVQKAVPLVHPSVIAAVTALGPMLVFLMQLMEGRVDYSVATLTGLCIYIAGALLSVYGAAQSLGRLNTSPADGSGTGP